MSPGASLGEFEQLVLLSVLQLGNGCYTVAVVREISARTGRQVLRGAVYVTLDRLESKGLLTSRLGDATPERGGRAKRFYDMTPSGIEALQSAVRAFEAMSRGLDTILGRA